MAFVTQPTVPAVFADFTKVEIDEGLNMVALSGDAARDYTLISLDHYKACLAVNKRLSIFEFVLIQSDSTLVHRTTEPPPRPASSWAQTLRNKLSRWLS
jgi:hypothetical protein